MGIDCSFAWPPHHTSTQTHFTDSIEREAREMSGEVFSGCQRAMIRRRQGNWETCYVCQRVTSQPRWVSTVLDKKGGPQRGEERERTHWPGSYHYKIIYSTTVTLLSDLKTWCPKYSWIKGQLQPNNVVRSTQLNGDIKVMIQKIMPLAWFNWNDLKNS